MQSDPKNQPPTTSYVKVIQGINKYEPYLIKDWLLKNNLDAVVRGFDLASLGALPNTEDSPSVWVPAHQAEDAARLILEFQEGTVSGHAWQCEACNEENPGEFGSCWSCGGDSPYLP